MMRGVLEPRLLAVNVPTDPAAVVLLLHGGASRRRTTRVSPAQLSVLRMIPLAQRISRLAERPLAVFRLLNSRRGWDAHHTPVRDVEWALEQVTDRLGRTLPVGLVGHSLGGRAALLTTGREEVRSVVALAPWVYPTDSATGVERKPILIVHGSADRVAPPARSLAVAETLGRTADLNYVTVEGGRHALLGGRGTVDRLAAQYVGWTLLGRVPTGPLARLVAGDRRITI